MTNTNTNNNDNNNMTTTFFIQANLYHSITIVIAEKRLCLYSTHKKYEKKKTNTDCVLEVRFQMIYALQTYY